METEFEVDVVILTRGLKPIPRRVLSALENQDGVRVKVHRVVGAPIPEDRDRLDTIVRARNEGKLRGNSPWLMFLDDDVVIGDNCITNLVAQLQRRTGYAALAADYIGQANSDGQSRHVAMGATLFRRQILNGIRFRYTSDQCECQCCCDDLRSRGFRIAYSPDARAQHLTNSQRANDRHRRNHRKGNSGCVNHQQGSQRSEEHHVLTCFDQNHLELFRQIFLPTLRASGNNEPVSAVTYGLTAAEADGLAASPGVRVFNHPASSKSPAVLRLQGFRHAVEELSPDCLVAYWDAGDSVFQSSLAPLWETAGCLGNRLGVVAEPNGRNRRAIDHWTNRIHDHRGRAYSHRVLSVRSMLNGGFATGKAGVLLEYLRTAPKLLDSWVLRGTGGYDQNALNMYCHFLQQPHQIIDEGWNYCVYGRRKCAMSIDAKSRFVTSDRKVIPVVHGNAGTLIDLHDFIIGSLGPNRGLHGRRKRMMAQVQADLDAVLI